MKLDNETLRLINEINKSKGATCKDYKKQRTINVIKLQRKCKEQDVEFYKAKALIL